MARQGGVPGAPFKVTLRKWVSRERPQLDQDTGHALLGQERGERGSQGPGAVVGISAGQSGVASQQRGTGRRSANSATVWLQGALQEPSGPSSWWTEAGAPAREGKMGGLC